MFQQNVALENFSNTTQNTNPVIVDISGFTYGDQFDYSHQKLLQVLYAPVVLLINFLMQTKLPLYLNEQTMIYVNKKIWIEWRKVYIWIVKLFAFRNHLTGGLYMSR